MEVFIVPYDKTMDINNGFTKQNHKKDIWFKYNNIGVYVDKKIADTNSAMQQIIPYTIIRNKEGKYFSATLKNKDTKIISIGFGNNLEPVDGVLQPLFKGTVRTLFDDVMIKDLQPIKFIGTVRDMATNDKHLGYVFLLDNCSNDIELVNKNLKGEWLSKEDLINKYGKLESWSKHIVNYMVDNSL